MRILATTLSIAALIAPSAFAAEATPTRPTPATVSPVAPPAERGPGYAASTPAATAHFSGVDAPSLQGPSLWGMIPWGGVGVGGRFMFSLPIGPLLNSPSVRDSFGLEVGADLLHFSDSVGVGASSYSWSWNELLPVAGMMWNIWLSEKLALYPKVEVGYAFAWVSGSSNVQGTGYGGMFFSGAGGALYKLDSGLTLRAEIGIAGLKVGAGWLF